MKKIILPSPCKNPEIHYLWIGGSCDYGHIARYGGGAYILEKDGNIQETYTTSDIETTEFRMMLTVMIHALETLPKQSNICFLTNVSYLQNFDKIPDGKPANIDLIERCINLKGRHSQVTVRILPYHKYPQILESHRLAHEAMLRLRQSRKSD